MAELGAKQPHELLLMLGGLLALLLTLATYGIQWLTTGIQQSQYATVTTAVIINVVPARPCGPPRRLRGRT